MKKQIKKFPLILTISIILIVVVCASIFAAEVISNFTNDVDQDAEIIMKSITGEYTLTDNMKDLADYNYDGNVNVLDVIAIKRFVFDGWTAQIY